MSTMNLVNLVNADSTKIPLADETVQCVVTSPPYMGLRDYGVSGQIGLEQSMYEYIDKLAIVFDEVWRVLRPDGTLWINIGDSYNGSGGAGGDYGKGGLKEGQPRYPGRNEATLKRKDLMGIPWRLAFALQERGWWLRSDIIWWKPNPMPGGNLRDRPTTSKEYIFLFAKREMYFYDSDAIRVPHKDNKIRKRSSNFKKVGSQDEAFAKHLNGAEDIVPNPLGKNRRDVWKIATKPSGVEHYAAFPPELPELCIKAGTSEYGQCPECGAPYERETEHGDYDKHESEPQTIGSGRGSHADRSKHAPPREVKFLGWIPTCNHPAGDVQRQIVLDPFVGSGTTVMVARNLGRIGIGLDLSFEYLSDHARHRCGIKQLDAWISGKKPTEETRLDDLPMFGG